MSEDEFGVRPERGQIPLAMVEVKIHLCCAEVPQQLQEHLLPLLSIVSAAHRHGAKGLVTHRW